MVTVKANIDSKRRAGELSEEEMKKIVDIISKLLEEEEQRKREEEEKEKEKERIKKLKDGLCFDDQHCVERNDDGTCKKCQKLWDEYYEQCLSFLYR